MNQNIKIALFLFIIGAGGVFIFLYILNLIILLLTKIYKDKSIKLEPDKSIKLNEPEEEVIAAISAALSYLRTHRYRYSKRPDPKIISKW
ncbi:MAG TPA: hypothetical protein PLD27_11345 [bacterium]|nr:hypothetical protein [bacterium]HOL48350.1 hypothetical protein [bacterium]HPQ19832.1 hypothetical protein [bacterium]